MKKWKIVGLIISQIALTYFVFIASIHQPKSKYRQVEDDIGWQESELRGTELRLLHMMRTYVYHPTTVTIERTHTFANTAANHTGLDLLKPEDGKFLMEVAGRK